MAQMQKNATTTRIPATARPPVARVGAEQRTTIRTATIQPTRTTMTTQRATTRTATLRTNPTTTRRPTTTTTRRTPPSTTMRRTTMATTTRTTRGRIAAAFTQPQRTTTQMTTMFDETEYEDAISERNMVTVNVEGGTGADISTEGLWWTPKPSYGRSDLSVPNMQAIHTNQKRNDLRAGGVLSNSKYISNSELQGFLLPHTVPIRSPVPRPAFIKPPRMKINGLEPQADSTTTNIPLSEWARRAHSDNEAATLPTLLPTFKLLQPTTRSRLVPVSEASTQSPLPSTRPYQVEHRQLEIDETFDPSNPGQKLEIVEYIYDEDGKLESTEIKPISSLTTTPMSVVSKNDGKPPIITEIVNENLLNTIRDRLPQLQTTTQRATTRTTPRPTTRTTTQPPTLAPQPVENTDNMPFMDYEENLVQGPTTANMPPKMLSSNPPTRGLSQSSAFKGSMNNKLDDFFALVSVVKQLDVPAISMAVEDAVKSANDDLYFIDTNKVVRTLPEKRQALQILELITSLAQQKEKLEWLLNKQRDYVRMAEIIAFRGPNSYQSMLNRQSSIRGNSMTQSDAHSPRRRVAPLAPPVARLVETKMSETGPPAANAPNGLIDISQAVDQSVPADINELQSAVNQLLSQSESRANQEDDQAIDEFFSEETPGIPVRTTISDIFLKEQQKTNGNDESDENSAADLNMELEMEKMKIREELEKKQKAAKLAEKKKSKRKPKRGHGVSRRVPKAGAVQGPLAHKLQIHKSKPSLLASPRTVPYEITTPSSLDSFSMNSNDADMLDESLPIPIGNSDPQPPGFSGESKAMPPAPPESAPVLNMAFLPPPQAQPPITTTPSRPEPITGPFLFAPPLPPTDKEVRKTSLHDLIDMLHNDLHSKEFDSSEMTPPDMACDLFQCSFENGDLCQYESSHDEVTRKRRRKRRRMRSKRQIETHFFTMRAWSVWTGKSSLIPIQIDEAPVFSEDNKRFAGVFLEKEQMATLIVKVPTQLRVPLRIKFRAFEATRDMRLRACCDESCPFSTESGISRGHRDWIPYTISCPTGTQTFSFECINEGDRRGACGVDDVFLDAYACPKLFIQPLQM
ncbi:hypothetical protein WR25_24667 isoform C [Diploscapter pachys]|uniref:MAM domain-containing protein n=1 Tax=Diploscapter pachys TaxID=2018661 RepID=A0A2A2KFI2_9BILA|nr:hypothetical protein WR25_24667 isoform A [Diploscapter pachys]PAV72678.1 hypothetical protein WR25_24667 isoform B [Diploscapter pachys]PAV72679.1 hypothetical protein WR25_24667 isoform C [Diploscapter pachys]